MEDLVRRLAERPAPFSPGDALFWTDPYVSERLLATHLDPSTDLASRRPETIAREVEWLVGTLGLEPGARVLDLGCGPGLYSAALAERGLDVTGVDVSATSLAHARRVAAETGLAIRYVQADYRELEEHGAYDAALLVYHELGVFPETDRAALLGRICDALRPGGRFAFDVVGTATVRPERTTWTAEPGPGFWRPGPHLVLERRLAYPDLELSCSEYAVLEEGAATLYRVWEQRFDPGGLERALASAGFDVEHVCADLTGTPWSAGAETIAVVARA